MTTLLEFNNNMARIISVEADMCSGPVLEIEDTFANRSTRTRIPKERVAEFTSALLKANGDKTVVIDGLPEVTINSYGEYKANTFFRSTQHTPEDVLENAKALLAIHAKMVEDQAKEAEEAKAKEEEAKLDKRRDAIAAKVSYNPYYRYTDLPLSTRNAIDMIIKSEDAK
jgi:hypothetical protein